MLLRSLFRNLSLFPPCYLYRSIPLLHSSCLFPFNTSHSFSSIHSISLFPSAFSTLSLEFLFPSRPLLFPISCSSFSYSPVEIPSQEYTIFPVFLSLRLRHVFLLSSSLYCSFSLFPTIYCSSFFFSLFWSLLFNPQFQPYYDSPDSSSVFLFSFCPMTFPVVLSR
jgi:hypothetical protein